MEDDFADMIVTNNDPHEAQATLESNYGSQQSGIQEAVIDTELTLAQGSQTPITTHRLN